MNEIPKDARGFTLLVNAIQSMAAIDELAALRAFARVEYAGDPRLAELERMIDDRANDILAEIRERQPEYESPDLRLVDYDDETYDGMDRG